MSSTADTIPASEPPTRRRGEEVAASFPALLVAADRVASTVAQGVHGRRRIGQGETFWQYRRFEYGDSPQQIDWRRSARSDRLYVRQTEWEAAQSVWLWPDLTASMRYSSERNLPQKQERTAVLTLALASLLTRGGERIALLDKPEPPATGRTVLDRISMSVLRDMTQEPSGDDLPTPPPLPRHSNVVLISDFLIDEKKLVDLLGRIAARGVRGHLLQVLDPSEVSLPFRGRTRFQGLESEGELLVGRAESLRAAYLERLESLQSALDTFARRANWTYATHLTNSPPEPAMLSLFTNMTEALHDRT
ncbi:MAG: DUF58 domain-containing protein [Alphaproteobacteria bacterium]|nr:DUF58 domain-containing protein [Alphaproteobacteria bacterium]